MTTKKSQIDWVKFNSEMFTYKEIVIRLKQGWEFSKILRYCNLSVPELKTRMKNLKNYRNNIFELVKTQFEMQNAD